MKSFINWVVVMALAFYLLASVSSCVPSREGFVRRHTTGAAYNKDGHFRERTSIPAPWK